MSMVRNGAGSLRECVAIAPVGAPWRLSGAFLKLTSAVFWRLGAPSYFSEHHFMFFMHPLARRVHHFSILVHPLSSLLHPLTSWVRLGRDPDLSPTLRAEG
jgi:hypothetical protein